MLASFYKPLARKSYPKKSYARNIKRNLNVGSYKISTPIADEVIRSGSGSQKHTTSLEKSLNEIEQELLRRRGEMAKCDPKAAEETYKQLETFVVSIRKVVNQHANLPSAPKVERQFEIFGLDELYQKYFTAITALELEYNQKVPREYQEALEKEVCDLKMNGLYYAKHAFF